jgi:hypothetical protein
MWRSHGHGRFWLWFLVAFGCSKTEPPSESAEVQRSALVAEPPMSSVLQLSLPDLVPASGKDNAQIVCNASECLIAWYQPVAETASISAAVRLKRDGTLLDQIPLVLSTNGGGPALLSAADQTFLVAEGGVFHRIAVSSAGAANPVEHIPNPYGGARAVAGAGNTHFAVSLISGQGWNDDVIRLQTLSDDATTPSFPVEVAIRPTGQAEPTVIAGNNQFLVAWNGGEAVRFSPAGVALDATPIKFAGLSTYNLHDLVTGVFDGSNYFIFWDAHGQIFGARVAPDGTPLDPDDTFNSITGSHVVCDGMPSFATAFPNSLQASYDGRDVLVSFFTQQGSAQYKLRGVRVDNATGERVVPGTTAEVVLNDYGLRYWYDAQGGFVLKDGANELSVPATPAFPVLDGPSTKFNYEGDQQYAPSAAAGVGLFLVAWVERDPATHQYGLLATRISAEGVVHDDPPVVVAPAVDYDTSVSTAWGDGGFVVVWTSGKAVHRRRLLSTGELGPELGVLPPGDGDFALENAIGCNDEYCLVGWRHRVDYDDDQPLYGIRIDAETLAPVEAEAFRLTDYSNLAFRGLAIASDTTPAAEMRTFLVAWSSYDEQGFYARRVRSHLGTLQPSTELYRYFDTYERPTPIALVSPGEDFVMALNRGYGQQVRVARIDSLSGEVESGSLRVVESDAGEFPTLTHDGIGYLATFTNYENPFTGNGVVPRVGARLTTDDLTLVDTVPDEGFTIATPTLTPGNPLGDLPFPGTPGAASLEDGTSLIVYQVVDAVSLTKRLRARLIYNDWDGSVPDPATGSGGQGGTPNGAAGDGGDGGTDSADGGTNSADGGTSSTGGTNSAGDGGTNSAGSGGTATGGSSSGNAGGNSSGGSAGSGSSSGGSEPSSNGGADDGDPAEADGGAPEASGGSGDGPRDGEDSGCGCHVPSGRQSSTPLIAYGALGLLVAGARRGRRRGCAERARPGRPRRESNSRG